MAKSKHIIIKTLQALPSHSPCLLEVKVIGNKLIYKKGFEV
jgi:hypothetical protein